MDLFIPAFLRAGVLYFIGLSNWYPFAFNGRASIPGHLPGLFYLPPPPLPRHNPKISCTIFSDFNHELRTAFLCICSEELVGIRDRRTALHLFYYHRIARLFLPRFFIREIWSGKTTTPTTPKRSKRSTRRTQMKITLRPQVYIYVCIRRTRICRDDRKDQRIRVAGAAHLFVAS